MARFRLNSYRIVTFITEEEMWQLQNDKPQAKGVPKHFSVAKNGHVVFWPKLDITKCRLMCAEGSV